MSEDIGRAKWLAERALGIGGTDAAAILGMSRFASPLDVWLDKTGKGTPADRPATEPMWWGRELEDIIARRYCEATGSRTWDPKSRVFRHPDMPFIIGTPDRIVIGEPTGVEIKTASPYSASSWGAPGTDAVPEDYLIQCAHYMAITGFPRWDLAVLIGGSDFRIYTIRRNRDFEESFLKRLADWWEAHVVSGARPTMDGSDATREWLAAQFPADRLPLLEAPPEANPLAYELGRARAALDAWGVVKQENENRIKALIGDRAGLEAAGWRATWKSSRETTSVDWRAVAGTLAEDLANELGDDKDRLISHHSAKYTVTKPGSRRFLFTEKE